MFTRLFWATVLALATALIIWPDLAYAQEPTRNCVPVSASPTTGTGTFTTTFTVPDDGTIYNGGLNLYTENNKPSGWEIGSITYFGQWFGGAYTYTDKNIYFPPGPYTVTFTTGLGHGGQSTSEIEIEICSMSLEPAPNYAFDYPTC